MKTLESLIKPILEKITQYFWVSLFLSILTMLGIARVNSNFFNYQLFETNAGIAQVTIRFLLIFSFYQVILPFVMHIKNAISNIAYENEEYAKKQIEIKRYKIQFLEEIFSVEHLPSYYNNVDGHKIRLYLLCLYNNNIKQYAAMDIYKIFEKEADERQRKETREGYFYGPILSEKECIIIENLLINMGFIFFDGQNYIVDDLLFAKLKQLDNRGILSLRN